MRHLAKFVETIRSCKHSKKVFLFSDDYVAEQYVGRGVAYITIQYRLGMLGLC